MKKLIFILSLFISANVFAQNGNIPLAGTIGTIGPNDKYPTHLPNLQKGGWDAVADIAARNAIPPERRSVNMIRYVASDSTYYQLKGDTAITSWVKVAPGNIANAIGSESAARSAADINLQSQITTLDGKVTAWFDTKYGDAGWANDSTYVNANLAGKTFFIYALSKESGGIPAYQVLRNGGEFTITPSGGFKLKSGFKAVSGSWYRVLGVGVVPADVASSTALAKEQLVSSQTTTVFYSKNRANPAIFDTGKYYSYSASAIILNTSQPNIANTGLIPITANENFVYSGGGVAPSGGYFDANGNPLTGVNIGTPTAVGGAYYLTVPNNPAIAYIALNYYISTYAGNLMVELGTVKTTYEPYSTPTYKLLNSSFLTEVDSKANTDIIKDKVNDAITHGLNYADGSNYIDGTYYSNSTGAILSETRYRRLPPIFLEEGTWTISGLSIEFIGNLYSSSTPTSGNRISKISEPMVGQTQATFTVPTGGAWAGINIERAPSGQTPSGAYNGTVMLAKGTNTTYSKYILNGIDGSKIIGDIPGFVHDEELAPVKADIDGVISASYDKYASFTGTSYMTLPKTYILNAIGDYVEITAKFDGSSENDGLGLLGLRGISGNQNKIGFYSNTQFAVREATGAYIIWSIPSPLTSFKKYRIEVVSGGWQLSIDGVPVSTQTKAGQISVLNLGNAYIAGTDFFKGGVKYLKIHTATDDYETSNFITPASVNISNVFKFNGSSGAGAAYPKMLYSYSTATGSIGGTPYSGILSVYTQYENNTSKYARFDIAHFVDTSIRADLWRVCTNEIVDYDINTNTVTGTGLKLLHSSENEYVIQITGTPDHTGGYHGDEILISANFFADGQPLTLTSNIALTKCTTFKYAQTSNLLDAANLSTPVNVMQHSKITTFVNAGYITENGIKFLTSQNVANLYGGLFCVAADQAEKAFTDNGNIVTAVRGDAFLIDEFNNTTINYYSTSNKTSAKATATLLRVVKGGAQVTDNTLQALKVLGWDRTTDFKYYLRGAASNYATGDYVLAKSEVRFFIQE